MVLGAVLLLSLSAVELDWRAPASCPAPPAVAFSDDLIGSVEVDVAPDARHVGLRFTEPFRALRELEVGSCEEARRVVVALVELGLKAAATPPPPAASVNVAPDESSVSVRAEGPAVHHGPWLVIGLGSLANVASMPGPTVRFTLSAGLRWGALEADVVARASIPVSTGANVAWWPIIGGELLGCWVPSSGRLRFGICVGALGEWWRVTAIPVPVEDTAFVALGGGFRVSARVGAGVELGLSFAARVHALRPMALSFASSPASVEIGGFIRWSAEPTESPATGHSRPE